MRRSSSDLITRSVTFCVTQPFSWFPWQHSTLNVSVHPSLTLRFLLFFCTLLLSVIRPIRRYLRFPVPSSVLLRQAKRESSSGVPCDYCCETEPRFRGRAPRVCGHDAAGCAPLSHPLWSFVETPSSCRWDCVTLLGKQASVGNDYWMRRSY